MRTYVVDAFTEVPFRGNPAGVVLLDRPADGTWMQAVAAEFGHAATAFVDVSAPTASPKPLRWFTPTTEVDLCGHATLATTHVLGGDQRFDTRSGILVCTARDDGSVEMELPADPPEPVTPPEELAAGLPGITVLSVWRGRSDVLVEARSAAEVRAVHPDLAALAEIPTRGVLITARGDGRADVVSRFFAPAAGIPEDPVTGSAHCTLASWWGERLGVAEFLAEQASERGGFVHVRLAAPGRVAIAGHAVTVVSGTLHAQ